MTDPKEPDLRKTKPKDCCLRFLCFAGIGVPHSRQGREEKEKAGQIRLLPASAAAREATPPPGTVARWNTRRQHSCARIPVVSVVPLQISRVLRTVL
jgi:hypothetical protein